jgi:hypothetical protein
MPIMSLIAGIIGFEIAKLFRHNYFVCGAVIAVIIPLSVSWMLSQLVGLPMLATLPGLLISEQIINFVGSTIFQLIDKQLRWWQ